MSKITDVILDMVTAVGILTGMGVLVYVALNIALATGRLP